MVTLSRTFSSISPIDAGRYGSPEMRSVFEQRARYQRFLDVEAALARAQAASGLIPTSAAATITSRAVIDGVSPDRIAALEDETGHELVAVVRAFAETCGDAGSYVHYGATSSDVLDTATALQIKAALGIIEAKMISLLESALELAETQASTLMIGRTHGQHAMPITFGFKVAIWCDELRRHLERLRQLRPRMLVGKLSGAVGSSASLGASARELESKALGALGLAPCPITNQAIARDRLAELIAWVASLATSLESIATEVRNLQRTEIGEVAEPFRDGSQYGSSTMPHKRNPVLCENVCSLARLLRAFVIPAYENMLLWHERDLTNSANERFLLPEACILLDEILDKMARVVGGLDLFPDRMAENLRLLHGAYLAEPLLLHAVLGGIDRSAAYRRVQALAFRSQTERLDFAQVVLSDETLRGAIGEARLAALLNDEGYAGECVARTREVLADCRAYLSMHSAARNAGVA